MHIYEVTRSTKFYLLLFELRVCPLIIVLQCVPWLSSIMNIYIYIFITQRERYRVQIWVFRVQI